MEDITIIGIDPGKSGGIAIIEPNGFVHAINMPVTAADLFDTLNGWPHAHAFVEKVNAGPKMGSSAAFKFGHGCGMLQMACVAAHVRLEYVTPQKWQRHHGLIVSGRGLGQGDTEKKNRNKARAQELFPALRITHAVADALLIAEYGRSLMRAGKAVAS